MHVIDLYAAVTVDVAVLVCFFFCKQKTAYEMRISDWSSDVCSADLNVAPCTAQTRWPSRLLRNCPGAQSRRRPACGQMLSQARTASPSRCRISDSASPSMVASASANPPSSICDNDASVAPLSSGFNKPLTSSCIADPKSEEQT